MGRLGEKLVVKAGGPSSLPVNPVTIPVPLRNGFLHYRPHFLSTRVRKTKRNNIDPNDKVFFLFFFFFYK